MSDMAHATPTIVATIFNQPGSTYTDLYGINDSGEIVGESSLGPFTYSGGTFSMLSVPGTYTGASQGNTPLQINNSGDVGGEYEEASLKNVGFLYNGGSYTTIDVPGSVDTWETAINNTGQVTGYYDDGTNSIGFLYKNGNFTFLNPAGVNYLVPTGINDSGEVTGYSSADGNSWNAFTYENGAYAEFGGGNAFPSAINNSGDITGILATPRVGFLYSAGNLTTFAYPVGGPPNRAGGSSINNFGTIVGLYCNLSHCATNQDGGFFYRNGKYYGISAPGGVFPAAVNDSGTTVGTLLDGASAEGFIATLPAPEPSSWTMMLIGFGVLGCLARGRALARLQRPSNPPLSEG
jgi:probable HAF family extracellular repeat protein